MEGGDRVQRVDVSCGLSWCLFTNLAAPASLLLTPCWQMLANCLCCMATQKSNCMNASSEQEALTLIQCDGKILIEVVSFVVIIFRCTTTKQMSCPPFHRKGNESIVRAAGQDWGLNFIEQVEHRKLQHYAKICSEEWLLFVLPALCVLVFSSSMWRTSSSSLQIHLVLTSGCWSAL